MTARHSTSERCPWLSRRHETEQNKAESLDAKRHSIGSDRPPSNSAPQGNQGKRGQGPERGTARWKWQLPSSRRRRRPGPPGTWTCLVIRTNKQKGHAPRSTPPWVHSPYRRVITSAGLVLKRARRVRGIDRSRHGGKSPNHPLAESPDSTKASGATVGYHD